MTSKNESLRERLAEHFGDRIELQASTCGEVTLEVSADHYVAVCLELRDHEDFRFETLVDLAGVDYLGFGEDEWKGLSATGTGFGRAARRNAARAPREAGRRFAAVSHLLSMAHNRRLRVRVFCADDDLPRLPSLVETWASANWYEREAFDLFGILFEGHPDLRRLLTDYGFIGHPFRKDFPLSGNVEVIFDAEKGRVVYQPVSIEPRTLVPRVIREDNRYDEALLKDSPDA